MSKCIYLKGYQERNTAGLMLSCKDAHVNMHLRAVEEECYSRGAVYVCVQYVCLSAWSYSESYMSHLVRRALGDTKATRSVCERLLERKISSLSLWEEVPRKIEPMNGDGASMCMCTIGLKCVRCLCRGEGALVIVLLAFRYITVTTHVSIMTILWQ